MAASTTLITNMKTALATGPSVATAAKALNPTGPIMDYPGNTQEVLLKLQEANSLLTKVISATDASDPSLATLQNVLLSLS